VYVPLSEREDDVAVQRNEDLLKKMSKPKPRVESVKSFVQRTLASRRKAVLSDRPGDLFPHPQYIPI